MRWLKPPMTLSVTVEFMKNDKKPGFNLNFINTNRSYFFLLLILFCGLFAKNFFSAYNICAVTGNGSLVIYLGLGFTLCLIAGHMSEKITNEQLAAVCGVSVQYFIRLFREHYHDTPQEYIMTGRLGACFFTVRSAPSVGVSPP